MRLIKFSIILLLKTQPSSSNKALFFNTHPILSFSSLCKYILAIPFPALRTLPSRVLLFQGNSSSSSYSLHPSPHQSPHSITAIHHSNPIAKSISNTSTTRFTSPTSPILPHGRVRGSDAERHFILLRKELFSSSFFGGRGRVVRVLVGFVSPSIVLPSYLSHPPLHLSILLILPFSFCSRLHPSLLVLVFLIHLSLSHPSPSSPSRMPLHESLKEGVEKKIR